MHKAYNTIQTTKGSNHLRLATVALGALLSTYGCNHFKPYLIEVPQGIALTTELTSQLAIGQSAAEVIDLLGSPPIANVALSPSEATIWRYPFYYSTGTLAKDEGIQSPNKQNLTVVIKNGVVTDLQGLDTIATTPQAYPKAKNNQ